MSDQPPELAVLRRLRVVALIEGMTLVCLIFVAVPMKHLFGIPLAVRIMGPTHGLAFVTYAWSIATAAPSGVLAPKEIGRLIIGAFIPFASFFNERWLKAKEPHVADASGR